MTGPWQLLIVFGLVVLLFGGAKLPQLARSVGEAQKEFQKGLKDGAGDNTETESSKKED